MPCSRFLAALACGLGLGACRDDGEQQAAGEDEGMAFASASAGDTGEATGDTGTVIVPGEATDLCAAAFSIGEGKHVGSLRGHVSDLGGACGAGGPDAFFRLDVPRRSDVWVKADGVGFVPRVGVLPHGCAAEWNTRGLACAEGVGTWVIDVAGGSSLVVAVGIDAEDPSLVTPPPEAGADALDFRLEVRLRDVLEAGETCDPPERGRCGAGTACLAPVGPGPAVCTALHADTCATAAPVEIAIGTSTIEIPADAIHSDAHAGSCGGARRPERVIALSIPATGDAPTLTVSTETPDIGLSLRGSDCDPHRELACVAASGEGPLISADLPLDVGRPVLLFVELPVAEAAEDAGETGAGEEAPIVLQVELQTSG